MCYSTTALNCLILPETGVKHAEKDANKSASNSYKTAPAFVLPFVVDLLFKCPVRKVNEVQKNFPASTISHKNSKSLKTNTRTPAISSRRMAKSNAFLIGSRRRLKRRDVPLALPKPTHRHEEEALDQSISWLSMKWVRTSKWAARSKTRCCSDGCSRSSASGSGGWQRGRNWRPRKPRWRWSTTSQKT